MILDVSKSCMLSLVALLEHTFARLARDCFELHACACF